MRGREEGESTITAVTTTASPPAPRREAGVAAGEDGEVAFMELDSWRRSIVACGLVSLLLRFRSSVGERGGTCPA
jgi:hypothetical protein